MTLLGSDTRWGNDLVVPGPKFDGKALTLSGFHLETIREVGEEMTHYAPGTPDFTRVMHSWESIAQLQNKEFP